MSMTPNVWVFFYGSYMDEAVLAEVGIRPLIWEAACLPAWDIRIAPRANIEKASRGVVWGVNAWTTHSELERLYKEHALGRLGELYLPQAVITHAGDGTLVPAISYVCPNMVSRAADPDYVTKIAHAAESWGFPEWYLAKIRSCAQNEQRKSQ